ncbi:HAMP domain-containing protein, partial [Nonomuraea sp. NPDC049695]|uniref:HAMP domain-containing protein n=1 Tax=Nonomuraea sp. NPDC049695 TaxID=3154734 RepID=UPI00342485B7
MAPRPSLGLRARLLSAFALLSVLTAATVAGAIYVAARNDILQRAQDAAVQATKSQLEGLFPLRSAEPGPDQLRDIANKMIDGNFRAMALYRGAYSTGDPVPDGPPGNSPGLRRQADYPPIVGPETIPAALRGKVAAGNVAWQRVLLWQGAPYLIIGAPVLIAERDGTTRMSGIEVYVLHSLQPEQRSIDRLATFAWLTGGAGLAFAVVLALLATRGVLGPVRELGRAARLLGEGELRTRIAVTGSDELADVARTFNNTAAELERHVEQLREMEADARRFVADVSHELRTPLAALAAVADVLDEEAA